MNKKPTEPHGTRLIPITSPDAAVVVADVKTYLTYSSTFSISTLFKYLRIIKSLNLFKFNTVTPFPSSLYAFPSHSIRFGIAMVEVSCLTLKLNIKLLIIPIPLPHDRTVSAEQVERGI